MFRRLSHRILVIFLLSVWLSIVSAGVFAYQWAERTLEAQYTDMSLTFFNSANDRLMRFLQYTEENIKLIASHPVLLKSLQQPVLSLEASQLFNSLLFDMNADIANATLYASSGFTYSVNKIVPAPNLEERAGSSSAIRRFLDDPQQKWMWNATGQPGITDKPTSANGVFSYLLKLESAERELGTLVVDLHPAQLLDFFRTGNERFHDHAVHIVLEHDGQLLPLLRGPGPLMEADDLARIVSAPQGHFASAGGDRFMFHDTVGPSSVKMVMQSPMEEMTKKLSALRWGLISASLLFGGAAVYLAVFLRNSIIQPLVRLYRNIKDPQVISFLHPNAND